MQYPIFSLGLLAKVLILFTILLSNVQNRLGVLGMNNNKITKYIHHSGIFTHLETLLLNCNFIPSLQELMDLTKLSKLKLVEVKNNPFALDGIDISFLVSLTLNCNTDGSLEVPLFHSPHTSLLFVTGTTNDTKKELPATKVSLLSLFLLIPP